MKTQSDSKTATIWGIIFFPSLVFFAYKLNTYTLAGEAITGGRYFWRSLGWSILTGIPFVGWILGFVNLQNIVDTRNEVIAKLSN